MQTSKNESVALEMLKKNQLEVFAARDLKLLLRLSSMQTYNLIKSLKHRGHIGAIKNGLYCIKGTDDMQIATRAVYPSYISFLSALNYYGFSDQVPVKITLATTSRKKHPDYSYATLDKKRFFGYTRIGQIVIAEKEKALVDALFLPRYAGGLKGVLTCLKQGPIDRKKLIRYARQMKSSVLMMRLAIVAKMAGWRL